MYFHVFNHREGHPLARCLPVACPRPPCCALESKTSASTTTTSSSLAIPQGLAGKGSSNKIHGFPFILDFHINIPFLGNHSSCVASTLYCITCQPSSWTWNLNCWAFVGPMSLSLPLGMCSQRPSNPEVPLSYVG